MTIFPENSAPELFRGARSGAGNLATRILGVPVSRTNMAHAVSTILSWINHAESRYVCVRDVHGVMQARSSPHLQLVHEEAGLVVPDGMPLVWISQLRGDRSVSRVAGADLVDALCQASQKGGIRHFFYGGADGVAEKMSITLSRKYPGLRVAGFATPPFRDLTSEENEQIIETIKRSKAQILWVGISTPKQELWMYRHVRRCPGLTMIGVGAAFDFHTGQIARAPKWMQDCGLEWLHRLKSEPVRLWRRYLIMAPKFLACVMFELIQEMCRRDGADKKSRSTGRSDDRT